MWLLIAAGLTCLSTGIGAILFAAPVVRLFRFAVSD